MPQPDISKEMWCLSCQWHTPHDGEVCLECMRKMEELMNSVIQRFENDGEGDYGLMLTGSYTYD